MADATVNGFKMHYGDQGQGETLLFLHGLGGNSSEWDLQVPFFSRRFRVVTPDLRGHGQTDPPTTDTYTPFDHAKDVTALLDHLGIDKAWIVGLSAGGFDTLATALTYPDRVRGIVLAATSPYVDKDIVAVGNRWIEIFQKQGMDAYLDRVVKDIFTLDFFLAHKEEVDKFIESQKHRNLKGIAPSGRGNLGFDVRHELVKLKIPVLAIHGLNDRVVDPAYARRVRQAVVGAEVKLLPDTGHIINVEKPEEFNATILDFMVRHGAQAH
ncbi:MAG: alpha/beta hydrolase [Candidatus Thermoplasmatota archaeon]|nr:alpha/beta hydrolase [Candidatus Thermoplasmatota archaeon]MCL5984871.1 alpha/beta hydrolase [Candidatus Thermoplasmatota archaeon]